MSTRIDIQRAAFDQAVKGFERFSEQLPAAMKALRIEVAMLLSKRTYDGKGAYQYVMAHNQLEEAMTGVSRELATMSTLVHQSLANYNRGDEHGAEIIGKVGQMISPDGSRIASAL